MAGEPIFTQAQCQGQENKTFFIPHKFATAALMESSVMLADLLMLPYSLPASVTAVCKDGLKVGAKATAPKECTMFISAEAA